MKDKPDYIVIALVCALIAMYAYFQNKTLELETKIIKQDHTISEQMRLIDIYNIYFDLSSPTHTNPRILNDPKKIIKQV